MHCKGKSITSLPLKKRAQRKHTRRVRFSRASCRLFKKDLTEEEKSKVWYNAEEFKKIQTNVHTDLRKAVSMHRRMMKCPDMPPPEHELNVRGLEHHLQGPFNLKRDRRRRFVYYVLHTNKNMRVTNPHELRSYALSLSNEDQYRAQRLATYDAYEAFKVHRETSDFRGPEEAMEEFQEFDNIPKASIGVRGGSERTIAAPLA